MILTRVVASPDYLSGLARLGRAGTACQLSAFVDLTGQLGNGNVLDGLYGSRTYSNPSRLDRAEMDASSATPAHAFDIGRAFPTQQYLAVVAHGRIAIRYFKQRSLEPVAAFAGRRTIAEKFKQVGAVTADKVQVVQQSFDLFTVGRKFATVFNGFPEDVACTHRW